METSIEFKLQMIAELIKAIQSDIKVITDGHANN
jgi:hypothetical protein